MGAAKGTASWNAGTGKGWTDRRGYRWIRVNGRSRREHRVVMEQILARPLTADEIVHHKDGDTTDNRPENLEILRNGDHTRRHHKGEIRPDMAKDRIRRGAAQRERIRKLETLNSELLEAAKAVLPYFDLMWPPEDASGGRGRLREALRQAIAKAESWS